MDISLMITVIAAFATPMILARFNIKLLPTSVAEIIVGIIIGKSCLNLVHIDSILTNMSTFGVILLLFLSGMEIDFSLFKKNNAPLTKLEQKQADDTPKNHAGPSRRPGLRFELCRSFCACISL